MEIRKRFLSILLFSFCIAAFFVIDNPVSIAEAQTLNETTLTMEVNDADIRDVLSVIALDMNSSIIFTGTPTRVSFKVQDVTPTAAMEYLLSTYQMEYIKSGNTIIIGTRDILSNQFFDTMTLTKFALKYVDSDVIAAQIDTLALPVQKLTLDNNKRAIWVQGLPKELSKVRELIAMIDRSENAAVIAEAPVTEPVLTLTPIDLNFITGEQFNGFLTQMQFTGGLVLESNPKTVYVYSTPEELTVIQDLKNKVDVAKNATRVESNDAQSVKLFSKNLRYITTNDIVPLIDQFGLDVTVITFPRSAKNMWLLCTEEIYNQVSDMISKIDIQQNFEDNVFFVQKLVHITAKEADTRLKVLGIPGLKTYIFPYAQFSKSIIIFCPSDYRVQVANHLIKFDVSTDKIKIPIDYSDDPAGSSRLTYRRDLLVTLTGIPASSFTISQNISRTETPHYVLILEETQENIQLVQNMIAQIDAPIGTSGGSDTAE